MIELTADEAQLAAEWLRWYVADEALGRLPDEGEAFWGQRNVDWDSLPPGSKDLYEKLVRS